MDRIILKWIICKVDNIHRERFSQAQLAWNSISGITGFKGQWGGFYHQSSHIFAMWDSLENYYQFMQRDHDRITQITHQEKFYTGITINLLESQINASGIKLPLVSMKKSRHLCRVEEFAATPANISVKENRVNDQNNILWMSSWSTIGNPNKSVLISIHNTDRLSDVKNGIEFHLEPDWTILPDCAKDLGVQGDGSSS